MDTNIIEKLDRIEKLLLEQQTMQKQVLNFNETCKYLELSQSHLYKLTSTEPFHIINRMVKRFISKEKS